MALTILQVNTSGGGGGGGGDATSVTYTPGNPGDWSPVPTTVQGALDELASSTPTTPQESVVLVQFSFSTSYPLTTSAVSNGQVMGDAKLIITTPFSAGASLAFGTNITSALVFGPEVIPQVAATYENGLVIPFGSSFNLVLSGTMAGATAGAGYLLYRIR